MTKTLRIGILGAAKIAPIAMIAPANERGDVEVTCIAARDYDRARAFADEHQIRHVARSYEALIARDDVDVVYIALPISLHANWAVEALRVGKHVLCEKPFAMNAAEAEQAIDAAGPDARLMEALHYWFHPAFQELLSLSKAGEVGTIQSVEAVFQTQILDESDIRYNPTLGGGAMMDLGCYPLHQICSVLGDHSPEVVSAKAELAASGVDVAMEARLAFANGIEASLSCSMTPSVFFNGFVRVTGDNGQIELFNPIAPQFGARFTVTKGDQTEERPVTARTSYAYQLDALADALFTTTAFPMEGEAILAQQKSLDAIYASAGLSALRKLA